MPLLMVGLSHHHSPVEVREAWAFTTPGHLEAALAWLRAHLQTEFALLSTCNRTELYIADSQRHQAEEFIVLLARAHGGHPPSDRSHFEERRGHRAVEHLFRVAAGLESMILGEQDIVRQVKDAHAAAAAAGATGPLLHTLFHEALRVAKRARSEMDLGRGAFSVGHAAAEMAVHLFGDLAGRTILVLGAGAMSEATTRHLAAAGATSILVANRSFDRAARLAETLGGRAIGYDQFPQHLAQADIVLAATAAPEPIVHPETVIAAMGHRRHRPLFLIDIAVPRDIAPEVGAIDDVYLYDIDDLQAVVDADGAERKKRAYLAEALIQQEARLCAARLQTERKAAPLVSSVRAKHQRIVDQEIARLRRRLPHLGETDWSAIDAFAESILAKIAHDPTLKIKEYASEAGAEPEAAAKLETARELFGIDADEKPAP